MARTEAANAQKQAKAAITSDSIAQVQRKIAQDSSMVAQKQRQIARDSSLVAQQQRDVAREQEKIAFTEKNKAQRELKERIKAENSFMEKAKNAEYAKLKAANAIGKWKLIEQLTQKRISAADAIIIIEAFGQGKSEYRDETFCCITDVIILKSKLSDTLYKIQLLGWNNRVSSELDLLPIPSLHNSFRGND